MFKQFVNLRQTAYVQGPILPKGGKLLHGQCSCVRDKFHVCMSPITCHVSHVTCTLLSKVPPSTIILVQYQFFYWTILKPTVTEFQNTFDHRIYKYSTYVKVSDPGYIWRPKSQVHIFVWIVPFYVSCDCILVLRCRLMQNHLSSSRYLALKQLWCYDPGGWRY